jgi:hypothetical protein
MRNPMNKLMLFLKIEEKLLYIWTCHVEKYSCFISITNPFHKFKHRKGKHTLLFALSWTHICEITRIKSYYSLMIDENYWYIWTCHVEKCFVSISITNSLHKSEIRKAKQLLYFALRISLKWEITKINSFYF